jgi:RNA polymerase sigma-70 factor (ECF subfamily)
MTGAHAKTLAWIASDVMPHEQDVLRRLKRSLGDAGEAADIVQEAYCRMFALADVTQIRSGRAFFFEVARNIALDQLKRRRVVSIDALSELDTRHLRSDEPSPEQIASGRQELSQVRALLAMLPDRCRRVIELRKFHGLSQKEVAKQLGVSENIVENDAARGLRLILDRMSVIENSQGGSPHRHERTRARRRS